MSKQSPNSFVIAWPVLEIDRRRGVAELMNCDPQSDRLLNTHRDLLAELQFVFRLPGLAWK